MKFPFEQFYKDYVGECFTNKRSFDSMSDNEQIKCFNPEHDDDNPSAGINLITGEFNCLGCGIGGDDLTYLKVYYRDPETDKPMTYMEALKKIKEYVPDFRPQGSLSLKQYSEYTKIPVEFLTKCGVEEADLGLIFQYRDKDRNKLRDRIRYSINKKPQWVGYKKFPMGLYGLWWIDEFPKGTLFICEGESDTQTLWYNNFMAVGVPGANSLKEEQVKDLLMYKEIFICQDADYAGYQFAINIMQALKKAKYEGIVKVIHLQSYFGVKDPSELYKSDTDGFKSKFLKAADEALVKPVVYELKQKKELSSIIDMAKGNLNFKS